MRDNGPRGGARAPRPTGVVNRHFRKYCTSTGLQPTSGSGARGASPCVKYPQVCTHAPNCGLNVLLNASVQRSRIKPDKFMPIPIRTAPRAQAKFPRTGEISGRKAVSLWTVHGPFLFFKKKRNGGCIPSTAKPCVRPTRRRNPSPLVRAPQQIFRGHSKIIRQGA